MTSQRSRSIALSGPALWAARLAWIVLVAGVLALWAVTTLRFLQEPLRPAAQVSDPGVFTVEDVEVLRSLGLSDVLATAPIAVFLLLGVVYFIVGGWIFWRRSDNGVALLLAFVCVILGGLIFSYAFEIVSEVYPQWTPLLNAFFLLGFLSLALLFYVFPDGRLVPSWTRFLLVVFGALFLLSVLPLPGPVAQIASLVAMAGIPISGIYAQIYRYRHFSTPLERQQTKWVAFGLIGIAVAIAFWPIALIAFPPDRPGLTRVFFLLVFLPAGVLVGTLFPVSVAVSVLRNRLWDIDILLSRTVVYGPLTGILLGLYVGSIRLFQTLFTRFTGEQSDISILLSTLVLAGAFMPLRSRLQDLADRYFKEAPDQAKGLSTFGEQMRSLAQLTDVGQLTRRLLDETVASFHAESGAVVLGEADRPKLVQTAGAWIGQAVVLVPLEHAGIRLGELSLGPRHRGHEYTPQDQEALREIAGTAARVLALSLSVK